MASINVQNLDEDVLRRLETRAVGNGRSLEDEARHILVEAAGEDMEAKRKAFRELSRRLRAETAGTPQTPSEILIRQDRDFGHRRV